MKLLRNNTICKRTLGTILVGLLIISSFPAQPAFAETRPIIFPVIGSTRYGDDFGDPRSGGRTHEGNDIFGVKGQQLVAAVDGMITFVPYPEPYWGYSVTLRDEDGYTYNYYHVNNDNPGTDDGLGDGMHAYAPDTEDRQPVVAGQLIAFLGDSGNAEGTSPHLHFEIRQPNGTPINPFDSLNAATRIGAPAVHPQRDDELLPFGQFRGGASIAFGDVSDRDGIELVVGAGFGGGPQVRVFDENDNLINQFFAFEETFRGGIDVATGDTDADGISEIIIGSGPGRTPEIRIFDTDGNMKGVFEAYAPTFRGGVRIAAADLNADGIVEIVTGTGPGGGPQIRIFTPGGTVRTQFFAYPPAFRGGVEVAAVAAGPYTSSAIIAGTGRGGGPQVRVFNEQGILTGQFFAYEQGFRGGIKVSADDVTGRDNIPEIITVPANGGGAIVRIFKLNGQAIGSLTAFEEWWRGGYDIATTADDLRIVSVGGRRTSIRTPAD